MTDDLVGQMKASITYEYMPMKVRRQLSEAAARVEALEAEKAEWLGIMRHLVDGRGRDLARAIIAKEDANVRP